MRSRVSGSADRYIVTGSHTYSARGSYSIQISFQRNGAEVSSLWNFAEVDGSDNPGTINGDDLRFLTRLYNDLLHRSMDAGDQAYWTGKIASGVARSQIAELIAKSQENYLIVVSQLYQSVLGRTAETEGKLYWSNYLAKGHSADDLRAEFLGSKEYALNHGGVIDDVVKALYQNVLNRTAETGESNFWVGRVKAGLSQPDLAQSIVKSEESSLLAVQDAYDKFLGRDADAPGLSYFANTLRQGRRIEDVALTMIASDEYFGRG